MPELPEVEITARRLSASLAGSEVESALAPGMVAMKSFEPPLGALAGTRIAGLRRIGKMPVVDFEAGSEGEAGGLALLVHLMSAGRLQVFDKRASLRDRTARVLIRLGEVDALRRDPLRGERGHAGARGLAGAAARGARATDRSAAPPSPAAPRTAGARRDRALVGGRDPLGGGTVPVQAGVGARGRGTRAPPRRPARAWRRDRPLRAADRRAGARQADDAAPRPQAPGRAVSPLRRHARRRSLRR